MTIIKRIRNAYSYGGIKEVVRKTFYRCIYRVVGLHTRHIIMKRMIEYGLNNTERNDNIVISLTSFPKRFPYIGLCLKSLLVQDLKPDKIIVYLGNDSNPDMLTEEMKSFQDYGIEYRFDNDKNLMPHKKYFYAMQEFTESIIVTADDDVIYPTNWLSSLYKSYLKYPFAVSARRVHQIRFNNFKLAPYDQWKDQCRNINIPSMSLIATGNGGVLYPPHCFDKESFDVELFSKLCLRADDLWLKCMEIRNRIPTVWVRNWQVMPATIDSNENTRLQDENIFTGKNDVVLRNIMNHFSILDNSFMEF